MLPPHPNRASFQGVLAPLGVPSRRPPSGARGHCVILPAAVAEAALPTLVGMALDFHPEFLRHDARHKVGVITQAYILDDELCISGYLFARDFPELMEMMERLGDLAAACSPLGLSYDITGVEVDNLRAKVWTVTKAIFTGAAILLAEKAAYPSTWIELTGP